MFSLSELWRITGGQLILLFFAFVLMFADLYCFQKDTPEKRMNKMGWLAAVGILAALGHVVYREWNLTQVIFMGVFSMEKYTAFLVVTTLIAGLIATLIGIGYARNNQIIRAEYFTVSLFGLYGAVAMLQSIDLLMMFIALEIMSIAVYVLAGFLKKDQRSQEGALKYFLLGSFGSAFFLFGVVLLYGIAGSVNLSHIAKVIAAGPLDRPEVLVAMAMIMAGLFFKMALVPFHMWTPDVYEGSPSAVTGYMATVVKAVAFGAFVKVFFVIFTPLLAESGEPLFQGVSRLSALSIYWKPIVWWIALLTMFFGNLIAVSQQNVKRMLAYSSIAHAGYMALGILADNGEGRMAILFYLLAYTFMNLGDFGVLYVIDGRERQAQDLEDYRGLAYVRPGLAFLMSLFLVSMAGLPPTVGFIAKFYLFAAIIKEGYFLLAALGILTSAIGAYYYLRVIYMLYMKDPVREVVPGNVNLATYLALIIAAISVLYLGILPSNVARLADVAQSTLSFVF